MIGNGDKEFRNIRSRVKKGQVIVDFVRISDDTSVDGEYDGICW